VSELRSIGLLDDPLEGEEEDTKEMEEENPKLNDLEIQARNVQVSKEKLEKQIGRSGKIARDTHSIWQQDRDQPRATEDAFE
jgi:hypothetical protein